MFLVDILTLCVLIVYMLTYCGISHLKCDETAEHLLYFSLTLKALCGHTVFVVVFFLVFVRACLKDARKRNVYLASN